MNSKQKKAAEKAERAAAGVTTVTTVTTKAPREPREPKPKSAAVVAAEKALAEAKAAVKAERAAERATKPKAEPRPTCTATKANGEACTAKAKLGSEVCVDHQPAWERMTNDEQVKLAALFERLDAASAAQLLVSEVGWHRAKRLISGLAD